MECLLSFIAFTQFQDGLRKYIDDKEVISKVDVFTFPDNIPLTGILQKEGKNLDDDTVLQIEMKDMEIKEIDNDDEILNDAKDKSYKLYERFIIEGSEFEINISGRQRQPLIDVLDNLDELKQLNVNINDLYLMFQDAKNEMWHLLQFSMQRFQAESDFKQVQLILGHSV